MHNNKYIKLKVDTNYLKTHTNVQL